MQVNKRASWLVLSLAIVAIGAAFLGADLEPKPVALSAKWGDQSDGTFINPIVPGDYSDLDVIRGGGAHADDFYAISSTFQFSPGMVILHSKDLVNWQILSHAVSDLTQITPELNWDRMDRYGKGIWAGSIRYHDGKYWIYFGTSDEGFFMTTAADPAGPWAPLTPVLKAKGWDDCCPFWDDDGTGYLVATNFSDAYKIHLFKMSADGKSLLMDSDRVIYQSKGSEANKLYKINGLYYHLFSEVHSEGRVVMMQRAKSINGPWDTAEKKQLNHVSKTIDKEPNQGGLIQLNSGQWWFVSHQGTGDWEGRATVLLPVTWTDGWPIIGKPGADGIGNMIWQAPKPALFAKGNDTVAPPAAVIPQTDDEFDAKTIGVQWEWNYQPRDAMWSLTERPGFLRLHAFKPLKTGDLLKAGNTLTQRAMRTDKNEVTVKLEIAGMADGQEAGLCHFAKTWSTLGISQTGDVRTLTVNDAGKIIRGPALSGDSLWLKSAWGFDGKSQWSYSLDGKTFTPIGNPYPLTWGSYRGDRIGLFSYNNKDDRGYVDIDWFHYLMATPGSFKRVN